MLSGVRLKQKVTPYANMLRGASHMHRLSMLYLLAQEPMTAKDILQHIKLSPPLIAHHLKALYGSGWITKTKYGRLVTYYLDPRAFRAFQKFILDTPFGQDLKKKS